MFDSDLNTSLSNVYFCLTRSFSNFNDSKTVSDKHVAYKKTFKFAKLITLCSEKLDQIKYPN